MFEGQRQPLRSGRSTAAGGGHELLLRARLRARYKLSTHDKAFTRKLKEIDLIQMISEVDEKSKRWVTQVLYFSPSWFGEMRGQLADRERDVPATRLFSYFKDKS